MAPRILGREPSICPFSEPQEEVLDILSLTSLTSSSSSSPTTFASTSSSLLSKPKPRRIKLTRSRYLSAAKKQSRQEGNNIPQAKQKAVKKERKTKKQKK
jgi:hypothetical protein